MTLRVYNSLTRSLEAFEPIRPGHVSIYVCGVTVYDDVHLGHARGTLAFEIIRRYFAFRGFDVRYIRNFTDVDDKIIARAREEGVGASEIAERYIRAFYEDMAALGIPPADEEPRATQHIPAMIEMIEGLIEKGFAYASGGDVYFSVRAYGGYGRLSGKRLDDLEAGARVEISEHKKDPLDFTLWKGAKPGEPSWESPWGKGRPGWHIECSAMSWKLLGETFDIHGGGADLIFPHHENELAQSCAYTGGPFARYWLHNGMVRINREKMSKSTGNFFMLKTLLQTHRPEVIRFFLAGSHYRSALEYSEDALAAARKGLDRLYNACLRAEEACAGTAGGTRDAALDGAVGAFEAEFAAAMDEDFNTPRALGAMFTLAREVQATVDRSGDAVPADSLRGAVASLRERGGVLLFLIHPPRDWFQGAYAASASDGADALDDAAIERLIRQRQEARERKDWPEADRIRDELKAGNVILEDGPGGTTWKRVQA